MRNLFLAIAMLWAPVAAVAQPVNEGKLVTHNGSLMVITNPRSGGMIIQYQDPRPDLLVLLCPEPCWSRVLGAARRSLAPRSYSAVGAEPSRTR